MTTLHVLLIGVDRYAQGPALGNVGPAIQTLADTAPAIFSPEHGWELHLHLLRDEAATQQGMATAWRDLLGRARPTDSVWIHFCGRISAQGWHAYDGLVVSAADRESWLLDLPALPPLLISADPTLDPALAPHQLPTPSHRANYLYLSCLPAAASPLPLLGPSPFVQGLVQALPAALGGPYARLLAMLRSYLSPQGWTPALEGSAEAHAWLRLFTDESTQDIPTVSVTHDGQQWRLQAGALQGVGPELLSSSLPLWAENNVTAPLPTRLRVQQIGLEQTLVSLEGEPLNQGRRYLCALPNQGIPIFVAAEALAVSASAWLAYPTLIPVSHPEGAPFAIRESSESSEGTGLYAQDPERLLMGIRRPMAEALPALLQSLSTIAHWQRTLQLSNPQTSLAAGAITLEVWPKGHSRGIGSGQWDVDIFGESGEVPFTVYAENRSESPLYLALLYADNVFGVTPITPRDLESEPLYPRERHALIPQGKATLSVQDPNRSEEHLILLASLSPFPSGILALPGLDPNLLYRWLSEVPAPRMVARGIEQGTPIVGWTSRRLTISLRRQKIRLGEQAGLLAGGSLTVQPHSQLRGYASLQATPARTRGLATGTPRRVMTSIPGMSPLSPAESSEARDFSLAPIDHLEIVSESNVDAAMLRAEPLVIDWADRRLGAEALLPMAFDGEFWVPVGQASELSPGITRIKIDHWPEEEVKSRSIGQALKLYFFKALMDKPGTILQRAEFPREGGVIRTQEGLQAAIDQAETVVIVLHGIIGNTQDIAGSLRFAVKEKHYDLVLTFDYENLATPISETAKRLKRLIQQHCLEEKTVDLVVHSMGGLVSRWLIEREGGDQYIRHLIMLGTPNGGSPFSALAPVIPGLIALAANLQSPWLGGLVYALQFLMDSKRADRTLSDMDEESNLLLTLNTSNPPTTKYTIIGGDVTKYQILVTGRMDRLVEKVLLAIGDLANRSDHHDIAVPQDSLFTVPKGVTAETYLEAGHHLNYFSYPATLRRLEAVIRQGVMVSEDL
jgi:hypothetical protein